MSKQKVEKILVPIDGSENAFRAASFAVDLASKYGSELVLLYIFDLNQTRYSVGLIGVAYPSNIDKIKEKSVEPGHRLPYLPNNHHRAVGCL